MSKCRGSIDIDFNGEEITLSLPMENLEKIESLTGMGMLKLISQAESKDLTLTNAALIVRVASSKAMTKKQVYEWIDSVGVVALFSALTELLQNTFNHGDEEDESDSKK